MGMVLRVKAVKNIAQNKTNNMAIIPAEEKVFMVSKSTNTTYSGSAALKAMQQWYTMEDVTNTVRSYQVFTALLTQDDGDGPSSINSGELVIGRTYTIANGLGRGYDFTNVGAPNNDWLTTFIATGTTPDWGEGNPGLATLYFNTGAPVATVLENTIGNVWFVYETPGIYSCESINLFTQNKTYSTPYDFFEKELLYNNCVRTKWVNATKINILTTGIGLNNHNNGLESTAFEIRVYN
jgi:hypothetical protein